MSPNDEKTGEIVLYQPEGAVKLEVRVENAVQSMTGSCSLTAPREDKTNKKPAKKLP